MLNSRVPSMCLSILAKVTGCIGLISFTLFCGAGRTIKKFLKKRPQCIPDRIKGKEDISPVYERRGLQWKKS